MPTFDFECDCGWGGEAYLPLRDSTFTCPTGCGKEPQKVWAVTRRTGYSSYPYVTKNILPDGSPITVTDASHERALMKQFNLRKRDDVAWIEAEHGGWDFAKKQHRYHEGSGRGLPGQWV